MTRRQVSDLFEDDDSTIDRYLAANEAELRHNGYVLMRGKSLKNIKLPFAPLISAGSKMTQLGLLDHQCGDELIQRIPVCCSPLLNHLRGDAPLLCGFAVPVVLLNRLCGDEPPFAHFLRMKPASQSPMR